MTLVDKKLSVAAGTPAVRIIEVDDEHTGQRIDNFLLYQLKGVPKSVIYRIIRKGEVRINKGRTKPDYKLCMGDSVRIPPLRESQAKSIPSAPKGKLAGIKNCIIHEDSDLIVINKPAGLAVHGGSGISLGVIESLRMLMPHAKRLELVHRLDRDTSGCLLVAKKASILKKMHEMIRANAMEKQYVALMKGSMKRNKVVADAPLKKFVTQSGERMVKVADDGKAAKTIFHPTQHFSQATLADITLITGRTHQIRVHSMHLGHSIAGDEKYGDKMFNKTMKAFGLNRLFLHARSLKFEHPATGEMINLLAKMDEQLISVLKRLNES